MKGRSGSGIVKPGQTNEVYTPETPTEKLQQDMPQAELDLQGSIFDDLPMEGQGATTDGGTESMDAYFNDYERTDEAYEEDPKAPVNIPVQDQRLGRGGAQRFSNDVLAAFEEQAAEAEKSPLDEQQREQVDLQRSIEALDPFANKSGALNPRTSDQFEVNKNVARASTPTGEDHGMYDRIFQVQRMFMGEIDETTGEISDTPSPMLQTVRNNASAYGQTLRNLGAMNPDLSVDPDFTMTMGAITEHFMAESAVGNDPFMDVEYRDAKSAEESNILEAEGPVGGSAGRPVTPVKKAQANQRLGQMIFQEYKRLKNQGTEMEGLPQQLDPETATLLGDMAKETYAAALGPDMITRVSPQKKGDQVFFEVSQKLLANYDANKAFRDRTFGKPMVRPQQSPLGEMQGEMKMYTKRISGAKGSSRNKMADDAMRNLNKIPNVVIRQRAKILLSTILEAMKLSATDISNLEDGSPLDMMTHINGIGKEKLDYFLARANHKAALETMSPDMANQYAIQQFEQYRSNIAKYILGMAMEKDGAKFLTYYRQAFNGRLAPQQTHFDPTTSKLIRFVTGNPNVVEVRKGTRQYRNIIQMYALTIGDKGTDALLPDERAKAIEMQSAKLRNMGQRLFNIMENGMTNEQLDGVYNSITGNVALRNPQFAQFNPMAFDPVADADLIKAIKDRGEDGLVYIDALIDFYKFSVAMDRDRPHYTQLNAYIDGKTNGLASNGMQMGDVGVAMRTGVIRSGTSIYAVDNDIDLRDQLQDVLFEMLNSSGFDGHMPPEIRSDLITAASVAFKSRALHKKTTMTFGYGKEIDSFVKEIEAELVERAQNDQDLRLVMRNLMDYTENEFDYLKSILGMYMEGLYQVMSRKGIESRHAMWGVAAMHAMADTVFEMEGVNGLPIRFAGTEPDADLTESLRKYSIRTAEGKLNVQPYMYKTRTTSAAAKRRTSMDYETGQQVLTLDFGGDAWGGAVPGPVQAIDAATVAMTLTGDSWKKLNQASNGKPYIHQIYDAFKMDVNGYDVVLEEVNKNWKEAALKWSYLKEAKKSLNVAYDALRKIANEGKDTDVLQLSDYKYVNYLINGRINAKGNSAILIRKLKSLAPFDLDNKKGLKAAQEAEMRSKFGANAAKRLQKIIPPGSTTVTRKQLVQFMRAFASETNIHKRLDTLIERTERDKKILEKQIKDVYQYYTH